MTISARDYHLPPATRDCSSSSAHHLVLGLASLQHSINAQTFGSPPLTNAAEQPATLQVAPSLALVSDR